MRVLIAAFSVFLAVNAYDAVYFSNTRDISGESVEELVKSASSEEPVVFIVNPDFSLGQFSVKVNAYSSEPASDFLAKSIKNSKYHGSKYLANQVSVESAKVVTSSDDFSSGYSVYILAGEEWNSMETIAEQVISKLDNAIAFLTSSDAVSSEVHNRVKRVATDEMTDSATGVTGNTPNTYVSMPLVLPPYNSSDFPGIKPTRDQTCLFYLEGVTVVVQQKNDKQLLYAAVAIPPTNLTWGYADGDVTCLNGTIGSFIFRVRLKPTQDQVGVTDKTEQFTIPAQTSIDFTLNITGDAFGYWKLSGATMHSIKIEGKSSQFKSASVDEQTVGEIATEYTGINSVAGWSLTCSQTQAVFFPTSDDSVRIGVALMNTQIQLFQIGLGEQWEKQAHFTLQAEDCTGTFSPGSWMGIVSTLVLVAGLIFGYIMLQSVQTMDRFDDPKQKQIVINVRE